MFPWNHGLPREIVHVADTSRHSTDQWLRKYQESERVHFTESRHGSIDDLEATTWFDTSARSEPYPGGLPFLHYLVDGSQRVISVITGLVFPWGDPVYRAAACGISAIERRKGFAEAPHRAAGIHRCSTTFFAHSVESEYLWAGKTGLAHIFEIYTPPAYRGKGNASRALTSLWPHLESFESVGEIIPSIGSKIKSSTQTSQTRSVPS
jgi:hypothetical protein